MTKFWNAKARRTGAWTNPKRLAHGPCILRASRHAERGSEPAIHRIIAAGAEAGFVGGEEGDEFGDFGDLADAAERVAGAEAGEDRLDIGVGAVERAGGEFEDRGADRAGGDGVDADLVLGEVDREGAGQGMDRALEVA